MHTTFTGTLTNWTLFDAKRKYGTIQNVPYLKAREFIVAACYNGQTNKGQQRAIVRTHVKKLCKEMEDGTFTPTPISASLEQRHLKNLSLNEDGTFALTVDSSDPLLLTDGGHRFEAIGDLIALFEKRILDPKTLAEEKDKYVRWLEQAKVVPFTVTVYFDGNPAHDFLNLQAGRAVDKSHMLSLKLQSKVNGTPASRLAMEVAMLLHRREGSPFQNCVKFDSRGRNSLPINTLCSDGASDLGTSLVGLAMVGNDRDAAFLVKSVVAAYKALKESDKEDRNAGHDGILERGKVLTPMVNNGTKGSSTMLTGVGVCLAYRLIQQGRSKPSAEDLAQLIAAAKETLDVYLEGSFSGPDKRGFLGEFAKKFFCDIGCPKHYGIPVGLVTTLSCSTFCVPALPKVAKPPKPKATKPAKETKELKSAAKPKVAPRKSTPPDVGGPITVTNAPIVVQQPVSAQAPIEAVVSEDAPEFVEVAEAVDRDRSDANSVPSDGAVSGAWDAVEEIEASISASITNPLVSFLVAPFAVKPVTQPWGQEHGFMDGVAHHLE